MATLDNGASPPSTVWSDTFRLAPGLETTLTIKLVRLPRL